MSTLRLSVIVPAYDAETMLRRSLAALVASDLPRTEWELIVADDGSADGTQQVALALADRVVSVPGGPSGPARARNHAAAVASGEVLVFVDADVCVAPTTLRELAALFRANADLAAAFGAYDLEPEAPGFVSQYRNLLHHLVHARAAGPATTFWAGCGAVRRGAFEAVGGFDARRYRRPQIEDVELGYRLSARGFAIVLRPEIRGKHLKRWTFPGGVVTDVRDRGVPWVRLLLERGTLATAGPLDRPRREQALTALVALAVTGAVVALASGAPAVGVGALLGAVACVAIGNASMLRWFARVRGPAFAAAVVPMRIVYYASNAVSVAWAVALHARDVGRVRLRPQAR